jgi:hypothetical protein
LKKEVHAFSPVEALLAGATLALRGAVMALDAPRVEPRGGRRADNVERQLGNEATDADRAPETWLACAIADEGAHLIGKPLAEVSWVQDERGVENAFGEGLR